MSMSIGGPDRHDTPRRIDVAKDAAIVVLNSLDRHDTVRTVEFVKYNTISFI